MYGHDPRQAQSGAKLRRLHPFDQLIADFAGELARQPGLDPLSRLILQNAQAAIDPKAKRRLKPAPTPKEARQQAARPRPAPTPPPPHAAAYKALGFRPGADPEHIRARYIRLMKHYHPDRARTDASKEKRTRQVARWTEAYTELKKHKLTL
jgi:DnaJ-domain-containing protein 1